LQRRAEPDAVVSDSGESADRSKRQSRVGRRPLRTVFRVLVFVCALFVLSSLFQSTVVRAADPDSDRDGLTDGYELFNFYVQRIAASGLPKGIIDAGSDATTVTLLPWQGVVNGAFVEFTVDHPAKAELTVQVGYWDGSTWVDRYVWDPGGRCATSCPTPTAPGSSSGGAGTVSFSTATVGTAAGYTQVGTVSTVIADLTKPSSQATQVERDNRILQPEFASALFHSTLTWRLIVRDWVVSSAGGGGCPPICPTSPTVSTATMQGSLTALALRLEERSDPTKVDTDGDGLGDGVEVLTYKTYPATVDSDGDGSRDDYEIASHTITYSVNGAVRSASVKTSPTNPDSDGDGLSDGEEYTFGVDRFVTNPVVADTDGDTLKDGAELLTYGSNATLTDSDKDTIADNLEVVARSLTLTINGASVTRFVKTLPYAEDSDGDGLRDDKEFVGTSVYGVKTDPSDSDTDDDGLADGQEKFAKEVSMSSRKTVGTSITVSLAATLTGAIERVDVRYGLSTIAVSNFYVKLTKGTTNVVLRDRVGSGLYNYSSKDITTSFSPHGGTYSLYVSSAVTGGVLEEYALSFTLRTSPVKRDSDGDGLNDSEEVTYGKDAWITDPNRADTDGDLWSDGYEVNTKGTNPLSVDTDQDGAKDNVDIDPLRNLLVAVKVKQIHHGAGPWCTPELLGVVRVNNDYAWVTQHVIANLESFTSWACPPLYPTTQYSTVSFYYTYYADVPDQTSSVSARMTAWSINPGRGDDILVDQAVTYALNSGTKSFSLSNGNSWVTFDAWTYALPKAKTLLVTDGNATVAASNGQSRLAGQDRYFVFAFDVTSPYSPFLFGVNTIVVPRSIFLDSKLKKDFDASYHWPLADATLYGEDLGKADVSEGVAGVIAKKLSGSDANSVLDRLLRNPANVKVYSYVDITSFAILTNLPADVVRILPWAGVTNGQTGAMPADFWQKIGAVAPTVVNSLVYVGQLIYKGLVALGTFLVDLGKAIADWGMRALGAVSNAVAGVVQTVSQALSTLVSWIIETSISLIKQGIEGLLNMVKQILDNTLGRFVRELGEALATVDPNELSNRLASLVQLVTIIAVAIAMLPVAIRLASIAMKAATAGVSWLVETAIAEGVAEFIVRMLMGIAFSLALSALFTSILETIGWVEDTTASFFVGLGLAATAVTAVSKVAFRLYESLFVKTSTDIPIIQRYKGFAVAVFGLAIVLYGSTKYAVNGMGRLVADFAGFALQAFGIWLYLKNARDLTVQVGDFAAPAGSKIEYGVTMLTPPVTAAKITHAFASGAYA